MEKTPELQMVHDQQRRAEHVYNTIRAYFKTHHISIKGAAEALGVDANYLSRTLHSDKLMGAKRAMQFHKAFEFNPTFLRTGEGSLTGEPMEFDPTMNYVLPSSFIAEMANMSKGAITPGLTICTYNDGVKEGDLIIIYCYDYSTKVVLTEQLNNFITGLPAVEIKSSEDCLQIFFPGIGAIAKPEVRAEVVDFLMHYLTKAYQCML